MAKSEKRFEVVYEDKQLGDFTRVLRDKVTGVCYLYAWTMSGGGLTVLVNQDGSPVVQRD